VIGRNHEAKLFRRVEQFRFADQMAFDFRGEPERNQQGRAGTRANSNQRARKGFQSTFTLKRDFGGLAGRYKLDWFFVKPFILRPRGEGMSYAFAPHFPLTMRDLNNAVPDRVSDHAPITVDLLFQAPPSLLHIQSIKVSGAFSTINNLQAAGRGSLRRPLTRMYVTGRSAGIHC